MLIFLITALGRTVALTPEPVLRLISVVLGALLPVVVPSRGRLVADNLRIAFPGRPAAWRARIARQSNRNLIETALLALASPYLSSARIKRMAVVSPELLTLLNSHRERPRPLVMTDGHFTYWETLAWLGLLSPVPVPESGVIYRALKSPVLDAYLRRTRERFGLRMLSRKGGLQTARNILGRNGIITLMFDQNAGHPGALTTVFGRICSSTELPGLFLQKDGAELNALYPLRTGFWRMEFHSEPITHDGTVAGATVALNRWFENALSSNERLCAAWLWTHARWKTQDTSDRSLNLNTHRSFITEELAYRGWTRLPRTKRYWVRLPNWLGDVVMLLPVLRAMRAGRPDAEFTLIGKAAFEPLVRAAGVADRFEPLPPRGLGYFFHFWKRRVLRPEVFFVFTHSLRGDLEAWLTGAPQRFGIVRPGRRRPLLTHAHRLPVGFDQAANHQIGQWEAFARTFGLTEPVDRSPLDFPRTETTGPAPVGLIAGSENTPAKRWPVSHWRALIEACPDRVFTLFGTARDREITDQVALGFPPERVRNLAGATDLEAYLRELRACALVVTNDTGGMHLANALGTPVIALFGPTNPVRTGPIFAAPATVLQPPGCPPTGGGSLHDLAPEVVAAELRRLTAPACAGGSCGQPPANLSA